MNKDLEMIDVNGKKSVLKNEMTLEEKRRRRQRQRARKLTIKKRRRKRFIKRLVAVTVSIIALVLVGKMLFPLVSDKDVGELGGTIGVLSDNRTNRKQELLYEVKFEEFFCDNKPEKLTEEQIYRRLAELSEAYPELKEIYEDYEEYPVKLLNSLCNNPELYEYVEGYLKYQEGNHSVVGKAELTKKEKAQKYPLFLQWDKRWGYELYGDFNIALSGCGPTTLAMVATALTNDDTITPDRVAEYSMQNGYYVEGTGTAWSLMTDGCEAFGIKSEEIALDEYVMKNQLDAGKVIICSMRQGDFTAVGHFIMIYGYDENGFFINDANCIYRTGKIWSYEELKSQIRILWAFTEK